MHKNGNIVFPNQLLLIIAFLCILQKFAWHATISNALNCESFPVKTTLNLGCQSFVNPLQPSHNFQYHLHRLPNQSKQNIILTRVDLSSKAYPYFDKDDYVFFKLIGVSDNSNLREMAEAFQYTLDKSTSPIEKMKLKDHWYDLSQKIIRNDLQGYKSSQISTILDYLPWKRRKRLEHRLISEFSETFLASSTLPKQLIKKVKRLKTQLSPLQKWNFAHVVDGGIFQLSSIYRTVSILSYMLPIMLMGGLIPKLSAPSIALNLLLSAGLISSRDEPKPKADESGKTLRKPPNLKTVFITMIILSIHSGIGLLSGTLFMSYLNNKPNDNQENLMSIFINSQYIIAALNYKTFINDEETAEQQSEEFLEF